MADSQQVLIAGGRAGWIGRRVNSRAPKYVVCYYYEIGQSDGSYMLNLA